MDAATKPAWIQRKARVSRYCRGMTRAESCNRLIEKGEAFFQHRVRNGLDHAELCSGCATLAGIDVMGNSQDAAPAQINKEP